VEFSYSTLGLERSLSLEKIEVKQERIFWPAKYRLINSGTKCLVQYKISLIKCFKSIIVIFFIIKELRPSAADCLKHDYLKDAPSNFND
jgi:hypothetical protein